MPRPLMLFAIATPIMVGLALAACGKPEPAPAPVVTATPSTTPTAPAHESANAEANKLLAEARAKSLDRSRQGTSAAIALLEKAVRGDRTFTRAYAELALAYGTLDDATDPLVRRPRAKAAAERAVALDPSSGPAQAALGFVRYRFDWQWTQAEAAFAKAVAANPNDAFARHHYGVFLATLGRTDDALRELGRAAELDPGSAAVRADMVPPLLRAGRVADARAALNTFAAAVSSGPLLHQLQSDVLAAEGKSVESAEMIARRIRRLTAEVENGPSPPRSYRNATDLALAHASLKHRDQTLHWLAVAIDLHEDAPLYMRSSASFDFVRNEPRFKELLRRAKLQGISRP